MCDYNTTRPNKIGLADSVCHTYLLSLSLYVYSGMSIDAVGISLLFMSTYTGKPTMFMNVFPIGLHLEKIDCFSIFLHFAISNRR